MRVLHLIPSFTGGGAERQLALLAPALAKQGLEVHVGFVKGGANLPVFQSSNPSLHKIYSIGNHDPLLAVRIAQLVRAIRPDVMQTWLTQMDVLGGLGALLADVPFILSERASGLAYPPSWKNKLRIWFGQRASAIVANSELGATYWREYVTKPLVTVIRNGLLLEKMQRTTPADSRTLGFSLDAELVLFAGRLTHQKNVELFIEATDQVLASRENAAAVIFGDGPLQLTAQSLVSRCKSSQRIRLFGHTNNLWAWMRRASVFVSPSYFEGNPTAVLEAMALGCPLVVSRIPEHEEILDTASALFCDPRSAEDIARGIRASLDDPERAMQRAKLAWQRASISSIDEVSRRYAVLYGQISKNSKATT